MMNLTFGEQVKIILSRKGMTIKQLAEEVEKYTGKPMSRQNMTQRLGRDNFQEQDMRMIADILGCTFTLSIMGPEVVKPEAEDHETRDITIGELVESVIEEPMTEEVAEPTQGDVVEPVEEEVVASQEDTRERDILRQGIKGYFRKGSLETGASANIKEEQTVGEINPYTRKEYETNSVRIHPKKIGYVQVYDRDEHRWIDMTEWAFLGYQEQKKMLLGKDYDPPIYLD